MIKISWLVGKKYEEVKRALDAAGVQCQCWEFEGTALLRRGAKPDLPEKAGSYPTVNYGRLTEYRTSRLSFGETYTAEDGSTWIVVHVELDLGCAAGPGSYTFIIAAAAGIEVDVEFKAAAEAD